MLVKLLRDCEKRLFPQASLLRGHLHELAIVSESPSLLLNLVGQVSQVLAQLVKLILLLLVAEKHVGFLLHVVALDITAVVIAEIFHLRDQRVEF